MLNMTNICTLEKQLTRMRKRGDVPYHCEQMIDQLLKACRQLLEEKDTHQRQQVELAALVGYCLGIRTGPGTCLENWVKGLPRYLNRVHPERGYEWSDDARCIVQNDDASGEKA